MRRFAAVLILGACTRTSPPSEPRPARPSHAAPADAVDAEHGEATVLRSRPFPYAGYFRALKRKVSAAWRPASVWQSLPEKRRRGLGVDARTTRLRVELDADGAIVHVAVGESSGVPEVDAEALRAFAAAAPFGRWPDGLARRAFTVSLRFDVGVQATAADAAPDGQRP